MFQFSKKPKLDQTFSNTPNGRMAGVKWETWFLWNMAVGELDWWDGASNCNFNSHKEAPLFLNEEGDLPNSSQRYIYI